MTVIVVKPTAAQQCECPSGKAWAYCNYCDGALVDLRAEVAAYRAALAGLRTVMHGIASRCAEGVPPGQQGARLHEIMTHAREARRLIDDGLATTSVPTIDVSASPSDRGEWEKP